MNNTLKISFPVITVILSVIFFWISKDLPGGMFFSGIYFATIIFIICLIVSATISFFISYIFKKFKFKYLFYGLFSIILLFLNYNFFSPEIKIVVDKDFRGDIYLVQSNLNRSILKADDNGICYLTKWRFKHTFKKPTVIDNEGKNITNFCKGFSNTAFYSGPFHREKIGNKKLDFLHFEILPRNKNDTTFIFRDLEKSVNKKLLPEIANNFKF